MEAEEVVTNILDEFTTKAKKELEEQNIHYRDATLLPSLDMRYVGQSYELNVRFSGLEAARNRFYERYKRLYGYFMLHEDLEIVNIRLRVIASRAKPKLMHVDVDAKAKPVEYRAVQFEDGRESIPVFRSENLPAEYDGAAIIEGSDSTTIVLPDMSFSVDMYGNIIIDG